MKVKLLDTERRPLSAVADDCRNRLPVTTCWVVPQEMDSEPKQVVLQPDSFNPTNEGFFFGGRLISPVSINNAVFKEGTSIVGDVREGIDAVIHFLND